MRPSRRRDIPCFLHFRLARTALGTHKKDSLGQKLSTPVRDLARWPTGPHLSMPPRTKPPGAPTGPWHARSRLLAQSPRALQGQIVGARRYSRRVNVIAASGYASGMHRVCIRDASGHASSDRPFCRTGSDCNMWQDVARRAHLLDMRQHVGDLWHFPLLGFD